jgi:hypothetical protein
MLGTPADMSERESKENSTGQIATYLASLPPFEYKRLDLHKQVFRLMKVRPRQPDGLIKVEMWHSDMLTEYRCLSYMWGKQIESHSIVLNDRVFQVRKNLYKFLDFASQHYADEPVWIDAICIDQDNFAERSHQVQKMGLIYSGAREVLVWLGRDFRVDLIADWLKTVPYGTYMSSEVEAQLHAICFHPYWSRAWIAQELLLQSNITILQRETSIPWGELGLKVLPLRFRECVKHAPALPLLQMWLERYESVGATDDCLPSTWSVAKGKLKPFYFWDLLESRAIALCSDNRDRIYSLLAMPDAYLHQKQLTVDYGEDALDLFARAGEAFGAWCHPARVLLLMRALNITGKSLYNSVERYQDTWVTFYVSHTDLISLTGDDDEGEEDLALTMCTCDMLGCDMLGSRQLSCGLLNSSRLRYHSKRRPAVLLELQPCQAPSEDSSNLSLSILGYPLNNYIIQLDDGVSHQPGECTLSYLMEQINDRDDDINWQIRIPMTSLLGALDHTFQRYIEPYKRLSEYTTLL